MGKKNLNIKETFKSTLKYHTISNFPNEENLCKKYLF